MQSADRAAFQALLTDAMAFWRRDVSEFALGVWWEACNAFDLKQVSKAITVHAMDPEQGRFAPMPADIVKHLQGTRTERAIVAWGKVMQAMAEAGSWCSVAFDECAIHAAIEDMGGWPMLCATTNDELPFVQKRFCDTYRAYAARPDVPHVAVLRGNFDASNARFDPLQSPVLIGDPVKAAAIAKGPSGARARITSLESELPKMIGSAA